jgi:hypothetical protein
VLGEFKDAENGRDIADSDKWALEDRKKFVQEVLSSLKEKGTDLNKLGVRGLGASTTTETIEAMTEEELTKTLDDLYAVGTDSIRWERELETTIAQTNGLLA